MPCDETMFVKDSMSVKDIAAYPRLSFATRIVFKAIAANDCLVCGPNRVMRDADFVVAQRGALYARQGQ